MGFLKFLLILLIIYLALTVFFRLFGPPILRYLMRRLARRAEQQFWQQQNQHQQKYDPNYAEEVNLNNEVKIKVPRKDKTPPPKADYSGIDDVDFEEVRD